MSGRRWTEAEDQFLKEHYRDRTDGEIGKILHRTRPSVQSRRQLLGLSKGGSPASSQHRSRGWSESEIAFLRKNALLLSDQEIAGELDRTELSVQKKRLREGISRVLPSWTKDEDELLLLAADDLRGRPDAKQALSELLGRPAHDIMRRLRSIGTSLREIRSDGRIGRYGYRWIRAENGSLVKEHRKTMEEELGRGLRADEIVHHINGDKTDNRPENLFLCRNTSHHRSVHWTHWEAVKKLIETGVIVFDREKLRYDIAEDMILPS